MTGKRIDELGSLQQAVMEVLWAEGEATVQQVRTALEEREPAYATILSVLQKLERAGWVLHRAEGRTYVYAACRSREQEGSKSLWSFVDGVFRGDPTLMFQHLIDGDRLGDDELEALRQMIETRKKERGDDE